MMRWILVLLLTTGYLTMTLPVISGSNAGDNPVYTQWVNEPGVLQLKATESSKKHFLSYLFDIWAETESEDSEDKLEILGLLLLFTGVLTLFLFQGINIRKIFSSYFFTGFRQNIPIFLLFRNLRN
ncbi:MAG: hypothetical protein K1X92_04160 [Bacteroidia bacterium]|nr:hypothetical protein [Bacteroidia bacterium]